MRVAFWGPEFQRFQGFQILELGGRLTGVKMGLGGSGFGREGTGGCTGCVSPEWVNSGDSGIRRDYCGIGKMSIAFRKRVELWNWGPGGA